MFCKHWLVLLALLLTGCAAQEPVVVYITATSPPATATATATETRPPPPTSRFTPIPTSTPMPTPTRSHNWELIDIVDLEAALREDGYRRHPFTATEGMSGFHWVKDNAYESITTWEDGGFELHVLHDASRAIREEHMERKFKALDPVFPAGFMTQLRRENNAYNRTVDETVAGTPDARVAYGDEWQTVWAQYYVHEIDLGGYTVWFSVRWWQSTCPPQYLYCYYDDFPGLEFTGDSSFSFYSIHIEPPARTTYTGPSS